MTMFDDREVCGTCKYHKQDRESNDGEFVCYCPESEFYLDWTGYNVTCDEWESRA